MANPRNAKSKLGLDRASSDVYVGRSRVEVSEACVE